jgi:hypothetical protein
MELISTKQFEATSEDLDLNPIDAVFRFNVKNLRKLRDFILNGTYVEIIENKVLFFIC